MDILYFRIYKISSSFLAVVKRKKNVLLLLATCAFSHKYRVHADIYILAYGAQIKSHSYSL